jgi:hypothetical protein
MPSRLPCNNICLVDLLEADGYCNMTSPIGGAKYYHKREDLQIEPVAEIILTIKFELTTSSRKPILQR